MTVVLKLCGVLWEDRGRVAYKASRCLMVIGVEKRIERTPARHMLQLFFCERPCNLLISIHSNLLLGLANHAPRFWETLCKHLHAKAAS
jgi:hypothetical protein